MMRRRGLGHGFLYLLMAMGAITFLGCGIGHMGAPPEDLPVAADRCMDGEFVYRRPDCAIDCEVRFLLAHQAELNEYYPTEPVEWIYGIVSMVGYQMSPGAGLPWEYLDFDGFVYVTGDTEGRAGEARGPLRVVFADDQSAWSEDEVVLRLSDSPEGCPDVLTIEPFVYRHPDDQEHPITESYTATRIESESCVRRRPACEL